MNANSKVFAIIVMKNNFRGTSVRNKSCSWPISEDVVEDEIEASHAAELPEPSPITPSYDPPGVEQVISLNAITGFSAPQTLKLID
jgi:hypothetical protein